MKYFLVTIARPPHFYEYILVKAEDEQKAYEKASKEYENTGMKITVLNTLE